MSAIENPKPLPGEPLDGGVASDIRIVQGPGGPEVVKIALAKLKVAADWFSDPSRSAVEVAAIDAFTELLGQDVVPEILWTLPEENTFAMRLVDPRLRNWKKDLLSGRIDPLTAARVGTLLGQMHTRSAQRGGIRARFADRTYFHQLRIEPFFLRVADQLPDLREPILKVVEGMEARCTALVHGDLSPKNILADGADVVILDFEVAHWGDPRFDVGFCISHLLLKSLHRRVPASAMLDLIRAFLNAYRASGPDVLDGDLVGVTACLLLARIKGSSPVDYLADLDVDRAFTLARAMLANPSGSIEQFLNQDIDQETEK